MSAGAGATARARPRWRLRHQGDRCISIDLNLSLGERAARECMAIAAFVREAALAGVTDVVPSFTSVAVHYRPLADDAPPMAEVLAQRLQARAPAAADDEETLARVVEVPVCYGGEFGPDLADVARRTGLSEEEVVALHGRRPSTVLMVGFVPGLPYMGVSDKRLALPRREVPRVRVEAGSVAIANRQTVIYPTVSPGGWHLIGRTPLVLFDSAREPPTLLAPGDRVRFVPISPEAYVRMAAELGSPQR